ncbi:MAG: 50S ribosomal protein L3 [Clostridia bacterium]|nr:50S ribosomal protein L3 [Clostridia bacterium]
MKKAILGKKLGMTQIFSANGLVVPVTVVEAGPCFVTQVKSMEKDGYKAVQVAFEEKRENLVSKPEKGKFKKAEITPKRYVKELALENAESYQLGAKIDCSIFSEGDLVDVVGTSKGHGWSGLIKKWNFSRMNMSHGNGPVHRHAGGTGANTYPGKVFKGHKMSGRWGNERVTIQNLKIVKVDAEHNIILIKGAVPGVKGSLLTIKEAVKAN